MAYALVVSLQQTLEPLLDSVPSKFRISTNPVLKPIYKHLCYMKSFFEKVISLEDSNKVEEVEGRIKDVLQSSQDLIESHISYLFHPGPETSNSGFYPELVKVNAKLVSFVEELKAKEDYLTGEQQPPAGLGNNKKKVGVITDADVAPSSRIDFGRNNQVIVGMDDELLLLMDLLTGGSRSLKVISIVGMGGIGKTTLAKLVYFNPLVIEHFDVCLFVEIGVEYKLEELLLRLLGQVYYMERKEVEADGLGDNLYRYLKGRRYLLRLLGQVYYMERKEVEADGLGDNLYRYLKGRRYLVVLDDIWDTGVWDQLRRFLPDNNSNGSAIILTTRIADMARCVSSRGYNNNNNVVKKRFLDDENSWELIRKMALPDMEEVCPAELENVGKTIAQNLGGLPLAIVMIGRLLSSSETTVESWMTVSQNLHSTIKELAIPAFLSLSYTQLPQHLKACFLYLGLFPPNSSIPAALLIKLWVAEGFIQDNDIRNKSLEEKAEGYLRDLVDRSLVIIDELRSSGGIKTYRVHRILQDLCVTEARHQKLFHIVNEGTASFTQNTKNQRRLGIYKDVILGSEELDSSARSLVFIRPQSQQQPLEVNLGFRWLRVLHALSITFLMFPDEVVKLVRLRYLAITYDGELPSSISRLRNLEFLIIHRSQSIESYVFLPLEIWELQKLRHLECMGFDLPDPSASAVTAHGNVLHLRKLATLLGVSARTCTEGVLARTPNLIKLGIGFQPTDHKVELLCFDAVSSCLHSLESFKCAVTVVNRGLGPRHAFQLNKKFPFGIRKLTLSGCGFVWDEHMTIISLLPLLQVLKLRWQAFSGTKWVVSKGVFLSLACLVLEDLELERWEADYSQFPVLEHLHIRRCKKLLEIPESIGDIPTLQLIVVDDCSRSVVVSAIRMKAEQEERGNEALQIRIHSSSDGEAKKTNPYDATTSVTFAQSTADISHSNENTFRPKLLAPSLFAMTLASENEVTPAAPAQPLSKDADYEIRLKTISQLQEDEESGQFWVYATISSIKKIGASAYLACELCFAELKPGEFFCDKCNTTDIRGRMRYNLTLVVSDETGAATFHLWESEFLKLIAETAYELNMVGELEELARGAIESLGNKEALFKVLVEEGQTNNFTGAYSVIEVISDADEIDKFRERKNQVLLIRCL